MSFGSTSLPIATHVEEKLSAPAVVQSTGATAVDHSILTRAPVIPVWCSRWPTKSGGVVSGPPHPWLHAIELAGKETHPATAMAITINARARRIVHLKRIETVASLSALLTNVNIGLCRGLQVGLH